MSHYKRMFSSVHGVGSRSTNPQQRRIKKSKKVRFASERKVQKTPRSAVFKSLKSGREGAAIYFEAPSS